MQTLQTILFIVGSIAYLTTFFFAVSAYFTLRHTHGIILSINKATTKNFVLLTVMKIQRSFELIQNMRIMLDSIVACEKYEEAKNLKTMIDKIEEEVKKSVEELREICGAEM